MEKKIKIAFIKFAGLASGGTERFIQTVAANLPKDRYEVDYFYTNAAPYVGSDYKHIDNAPDRKAYLEAHGVNLIEVFVAAKDVTNPIHTWVNTNLFDLFDESRYDIIQTGRAGHPEYPFTEIKKTPIVDAITLSGMVDNQSNIYKSVHISKFQKDEWVKAGGDPNRAIVIPLFSEEIVQSGLDLRSELGIPESDFVFGFHQRPDDGIYFPAALEAYSRVMNDKTHFVLLGGSDLYSKAAQELKLINFRQLPATSEDSYRDKFLETLDVFSHSRRDGETFGLSIAEAMAYGLPIVSHYAQNNGHIETIGDAGFVCRTLDEYIDKLKSLVEDKNLYVSLSKKAISRYNNVLSLDANMHNFMEIYESVYKKMNKYNLPAEDFWNEQ